MKPLSRRISSGLVRAKVSVWAVALAGTTGSCVSDVDRTPVLRDDVGRHALLDHLSTDTGSTGGPPCLACAEERCTLEAQRCQEDPGCAVYRSCLWSCPEREGSELAKPCFESCPVADNSTTALLANQLESCLASGDCSGCSTDAGSGPPGENQPARPECFPPSGEPNECRTCLWSECCDYQLECSAEPACDAFLECLRSCPTVAECLEPCSQEHPAGRSHFLRLESCGRLRCFSECIGPDACVDCTDRECSALALACFSDDDCLEYYACLTGCGGAPDPVGCQSQCATGLERHATLLHETWVDCTVAKCKRECL